MEERKRRRWRWRSRTQRHLDDGRLRNGGHRVVDAEEDGDLRERGQAASERVDVQVLVQVAHRRVLDLVVVAVPELDAVLHRLDRLHAGGRGELVPVEWQRDQLDAKHKREDCQPVRVRQVALRILRAQAKDAILNYLRRVALQLNASSGVYLYRWAELWYEPMLTYVSAVFAMQPRRGMVRIEPPILDT